MNKTILRTLSTQLTVKKSEKEKSLRNKTMKDNLTINAS